MRVVFVPVSTARTDNGWPSMDVPLSMNVTVVALADMASGTSARAAADTQVRKRERNDEACKMGMERSPKSRLPWRLGDTSRPAGQFCTAWESGAAWRRQRRQAATFVTGLDGNVSQLRIVDPQAQSGADVNAKRNKQQ